MQGVVEVDDDLLIGEALDQLLLLFGATNDDEWEGQVKFIPLR